MKSCLSKSVLSVWRGRNLNGSLDVTVFSTWHCTVQLVRANIVSGQEGAAPANTDVSRKIILIVIYTIAIILIAIYTCHLFFFSLSVLSCIIVIIPFIWTSLNLDPPWGGYSPKDYFSLENTHLLFVFLKTALFTVYIFDCRGCVWEERLLSSV